MELPYGEEIMIERRTMWAQSTSVTDRQIDEQIYDDLDRKNKKLSYCYRDRATRKPAKDCRKRLITSKIKLAIKLAIKLKT